MEIEKLFVSQLKEEKLYFTIKEISQEIKHLLDRGFTHLWLEGELSNIKHSQVGNIYLNLVDEDATLKAIIFRDQRSEIDQTFLQEGKKVLVFGRLTFFTRTGEVFFIVKRLEPLGIGKLHRKKEILIERYKHLFDPNLKREIPSFPKKIALVTSLFGAALQDFLKVSENRWGVDILIYPVKVQGEGAHLEIVQAIQDINNYFPEVDLIVITRGGGSLEDLAPFYTEEIILGVRQSRIPVVSAVGHEIDTTLCDLAADKRCPTPSSAAQQILPSREELLEKLRLFNRKLYQLLELTLSKKEKRIKDLHLALQAKNPFREIHHLEQKLKDYRLLFFQKISHSLNKRESLLTHLKKDLQSLNPINLIEAKEEKLKHMKMLLFSLSPYNILKRGYSIVKKYPERRTIKSVHDVEEGSLIEVILYEGTLLAKVEKVKDKP